jgi:hypothetical protein
LKKLAKAFCLVLISALITSPAPVLGKQKTAKPKPDFTGTWLLDRTKSNIGPPLLTDQPLKIVHHDPELRVIHRVQNNGQSVEKDFVYYSDGRGETNPTTMYLSTGTDMNKPRSDKDVTKSKTRWDGNKLVTRSTLSSIIGGHSLEFDIVDEWKLSKDGKTLTQTSRTVFREDMSGGIFVPANRPDNKRVYNRVPD